MTKSRKFLACFSLMSCLSAGTATAADQVFTWNSGGNHQDNATVTISDKDGVQQIHAAFTSYDTTEQDFVLDMHTDIITAHVFTPWDGSQTLTVPPPASDLTGKFAYIGVSYDMRKIVETVATNGGTVSPRPELAAALARLGGTL